MMKIPEAEPAAPMTRRELYDKQVLLLKTFLEHGAISQEQFDKSYRDLTLKMGY